MPAEKIETAVTQQLGIRYPIVVAPMFLVSSPPLLEAAARAGGIGVIPSLNFRSPEAFKGFLELFPRELAFGVNLNIKWGDRLAEDIQAVVDRKTPLVITSLGDPTEVVKAVRAYGGKVWCDVISLRHAEKALKAGADALVAIGSGAGGHAGVISPLVLGPWLKQEFNCPVILAGGVATGRHLAAALAMGCDAGYFGTRFIASSESNAPAEYKQLLISAGPEDIEWTSEVSGVNGNFLKQSLEKFRKGEGKAWLSVFSAGHGVAFIKDIAPAKALISRIVSEYEEAKGKMP